MPRQLSPFSAEELQRIVLSHSENGEEVLQLEQLEPGHVLLTFDGGKEHCLKLPDGTYVWERDDLFWWARNFAENDQPTRAEVEDYMRKWTAFKEGVGVEEAKRQWRQWVKDNGLAYGTDPDGE